MVQIRRPSLRTGSTGAAWGFAGVLAFSFTVPFTRVALEELSPLFVGAGRSVIAASLAAAVLVLTRQARPQGTQWMRLAIVASGVVVGFPLLTSLALTSAEASHSAVVIAALPAATAVAVVLRVRERPRPAFWVVAFAGAAIAIAYAALNVGGFADLRWSDTLLLGAVVAAAVGYAEGGTLARELGAWQTVSWALVLALPIMTPLTVVAVVQDNPTSAGVTSWAAFGYLGIVSMFLGFFAWYRGLAIGPMSAVSQIQLVQPVMTIGWAALILGERITWEAAVGGLAIIGCAALALRLRPATSSADLRQQPAQPGACKPRAR